MKWREEQTARDKKKENAETEAREFDRPTA
jgi:hypothetical protein